MRGATATVSAMIRDPFLKTQGIHNFRDYGGWATKGGGAVRTGLLFRSGHHVGATDADLAAIAPLKYPLPPFSSIIIPAGSSR